VDTVRGGLGTYSMDDSEHKTQNAIRLALSPGSTLFRANVGRGWVGQLVSNQGGMVMLSNARPFTTGLPVGFSDLFGWVTVDGVARFLALEIKSKTGRVTPEQENFLAAVKRAGGLAGVARSIDDARKIVQC